MRRVRICIYGGTDIEETFAGFISALHGFRLDVRCDCQRRPAIRTRIRRPSPPTLPRYWALDATRLSTLQLI